MKKNFGKNDRLAKETSKVIESGIRIKSGNIIMYYLPANRPKLSIVIGRKVGKSVLRNKLKRWTREIFRIEKEKLNSFAIVIIYKQGSDKYTLKDIKEKIFDLWSKTKIIKSNVVC